MKLLYGITPQPMVLVQISTDDFGDEFMAVTSHVDANVLQKVIDLFTWCHLFDMDQEIQALSN